ncbi:ATP-binding protein involved in chromosome partitioning [Ferrimonas sediminum]|uniref:Iron-sulfur cluster carrier protein n=1 Tax=Ferrimonas sediminum TaxID=718193 RepID=A0A1G8VZV5_9GAMM|nr:iron-sulfur cluster carrier protein ApbC [Ferrimonas sediminum]SDJ71387.1 ATP-binding protein involved in chromosome partitioning [Ferrimonas sediminum]
MNPNPINDQLPEALSAKVLSILSTQIDPFLNQNLVEAGLVRSLDLDGRCLKLGLVYPYPCQSKYRQRVMALTNALAKLEEIDEVECEIGLSVPQVQAEGQAEAVKGVKNIVAVSSGKGGVGKSTTAVNLALALASEGARVGLLDADIYGPSVPIMLGVNDFQPVSTDGKTMEPAFAHGLAAMSIGFMVTEDQATVWRGPMAAGALVQLLNETNWPDLDYLVIDMPPGTGDIQLTLSQQVPVAGAVVVTTPQDIATADARKGITMFNKVNIPVLGIVENMSYHICGQCGSKEHPFGTGGGQATAERYDVPMLGELPLNVAIREAVDGGNPTVVADPDGDISAQYKAIAHKTAAALVNLSEPTALEIEICDE